jgi:hypothetical protein
MSTITGCGLLWLFKVIKDSLRGRACDSMFRSADWILHGCQARRIACLLPTRPPAKARRAGPEILGARVKLYTKVPFLYYL